MRSLKPATALLFAVIIAASIAALWALSHKPAGDPRATAALSGTWRDDGRVFTLRPDGLYWAAVVAGTSGDLAATECGRWQASDGILTLRATWTAERNGALATAQLREPGMHLGSWEGANPSEITLITAEPTAPRTEGRRTERLHRGVTPESAAMPPEDRRRLESACRVHLPD